MSTRDEIEAVWSVLTAAVVQGDASRAAAVVAAAVGVGLLQAAGAGALLAAREGVEGAAAATRTVVAALRERDWPGDAQLIELLSATGSGATTGRTPMRVDLDSLGEVLDDWRGGYLELSTGISWPVSLFEDGMLDGPGPEDDPDGWLDVPGEDSRDAWRDMFDFAHHVDDPRARQDLAEAVDGRGAFRRFQAALDRHEAHRADWTVFSSERRTGRARDWLADEGYDAVPWAVTAAAG